MATLSDGGAIIQVNGCGLHYWAHGQGDPVVMTHDAGMDHTVFDAQVAYLLEAGYRVVTWDLPGHGLSQPSEVPFGPGTPAEPFDPARAVDDLRVLLETLSIVRPVLVGQGLGGNISQAFVRRAPDHVRALVVIGAASNTGRISLGERLVRLVKAAVVRRVPAGRLPAVLANRATTTRTARAYAERCYARAGHEELLNLWRSPDLLRARKRFYRTPVPLCLIRGERDKTGTVATSMRRWAGKDLVRVNTVPDAGHLATLDAPNGVNAALGTFLESLRPAARDW
ncbi:alpha/beta fold hydrolase [Georgenia sp. SYP-B2076]|uniref:alpha/beta fold hydrolase n=1 Tax=Georgenia sp. SYP-B2076 TaxID=2495881 RepID=UPI00197AE59E|nr:alpha/beta hydrolase [Georgenia sp. SYP-B2076]